MSCYNSLFLFNFFLDEVTCAYLFYLNNILTPYMIFKSRIHKIIYGDLTIENLNIREKILTICMFGINMLGPFFVTKL